MKNNIKYIAIALWMMAGISSLMASSHREAPLIANDPLADNTDVYAFRSPDDTNTVTIIANYIPFQSPQGGPNYFTFGENIRYEIHIVNSATATSDNITYRFTFYKTNQDPTTFFNIRLGKQNQMTTYKLEKIVNGGAPQVIVASGVVPPNNIGPRSIGSAAGLNTTYSTLFASAVTTASSGGGEIVFAGPVDDPFFVDLGGIFDLGDAPRTGGSGTPQDGLACKNVSTIALKIPIATLQASGHSVASAVNILDSSFVIGVWASASRPQIRTLSAGKESYDTTGTWVQVSRLGMPLTNEAINPIGKKDLWNSMTPYQDLAANGTFGIYYYQPELALYIDTTAGFYGSAVPSFHQPGANLIIQRNSYTALGNVGFGNNQQGLYPVVTDPLNYTYLLGTAFDPTGPYVSLLAPNANSPRSADIWPIFHTGVPNLSPYQLATGKATGNPFSAGKPFINNFLPNGGDMLRLNMAVPVTSRSSADFSSEGIVQAAVLGLTDARFNTSTTLQFIPNMDGFPNGRRLEDDVTRIELQAVSGIALAAIGLFYDDYQGTGSPVTADLLGVLGYSTGVTHNDTTLRTTFPYEQTPWEGTGRCGGQAVAYTQPAILSPTPPNGILGIASPTFIMTISPNPVSATSILTYHVAAGSNVNIGLYNVSGQLVATLIDANQAAGDYTLAVNGSNLTTGVYFIKAAQGNSYQQTLRIVKAD
jgi:hypothetical protein